MSQHTFTVIGWEDDEDYTVMAIRRQSDGAHYDFSTEEFVFSGGSIFGRMTLDTRLNSFTYYTLDLTYWDDGFYDAVFYGVEEGEDIEAAYWWVTFEVLDGDFVSGRMVSAMGQTNIVATLGPDIG